MALALLGLGALVTALLMVSLWALSSTGVPVHASRPEAVDAALDLLALRDGERFADLGCGFGGVLRRAQTRAGVQCAGWELNPFAFLFCCATTGWRTRVRWGDFRRADLKRFDAVYLYMMPRFLERNAGWIETAFQQGTRVVAIDFPVPGWQPEAVREVGPLRQPIRLYMVGRHLPAPAHAGESPSGPTSR